MPITFRVELTHTMTDYNLSVKNKTKWLNYAGRVSSGKRNASVWGLSVRPSVSVSFEK